MTKNINILTKSTLSKLMARKHVNLVYDPSVKTASYDSTTQTVTLPIFEKMNNRVNDWFIAHEVSHAIFTPDINKVIADLKKENIEFVVFNIVEDARIEKLIMREYPGSVKDNKSFYGEFVKDNDFFKLKGKDLKTYSLLDRLNLFFKAGKYIDVPFRASEIQYINLLNNLETYEDVLNACRVINKYKPNKQEQFSYIGTSKQKNSGGGKKTQQQDQKDNTSDNTSPDTTKDDSQSTEQDNSTTSSDENNTPKENDSSGGDSEDQQSNVENNDSVGDDVNETGDVGKDKTDFVPDQDQTSEETEKIGITQESLDGNISKTTLAEIQNIKSNNVVTGCPDETFDWVYYKTHKPKNKSVSAEYTKFKQEISPIINNLINQFNMYKSASDFAKIKTSKTGKLDTDKLVDYKFSDDIFLRGDIHPDAKNHGIIFVIDWSGSMSYNIRSTLKQLFMLTEFCQRMSIPYVVYAFTENGMCFSRDNKLRSNNILNCTKLIEYTKSYSEYSTTATSLLTQSPNDIMGMGGTPINGIALYSAKIINDFRSKYKVDKLNYIFLSDGASNDWVVVNGKGGNVVCINDNNYTGKTFYSTKNIGYHTVFKYIKDSFNLNRLIGFYIGSNDTSVVNMLNPEYSASTKVKNNNGDRTISLGAGPAFDEYYIVPPSSLRFKSIDEIFSQNNNEIILQSDLKKIGTEYKKNMGAFLFLNAFIKLIA